jgi:hypothetical protein
VVKQALIDLNLSDFSSPHTAHTYLLRARRTGKASLPPLLLPLPVPGHVLLDVLLGCLDAFGGYLGALCLLDDVRLRVRALYLGRGCW